MGIWARQRFQSKPSIPLARVHFNYNYNNTNSIMLSFITLRWLCCNAHREYHIYCRVRNSAFTRCTMNVIIQARLRFTEIRFFSHIVSYIKSTAIYTHIQSMRENCNYPNNTNSIIFSDFRWFQTVVVQHQLRTSMYSSYSSSPVTIFWRKGVIFWAWLRFIFMYNLSVARASVSVLQVMLIIQYLCSEANSISVYVYKIIGGDKTCMFF